LEAGYWARPTSRLDLAVFLQFLATGVALGSVPRYLRDELGASRALTGFATTIFFIAALAARPFVGRFLDRSGSRLLLIYPPVIMGVLVVSLHWANTPYVVAALRFIAGAVGACFYTAALSLTTELASPNEQTKAVARLSVAVYLGFIIGPLLAEQLLRSGFFTVWIGAAACHAAAVVAARFVAMPSRPVRATQGVAKLTIYRGAIAPGIALLTVAFAFSTVSAFTPDYAKNLNVAHPSTLFATFAASVLAIRLVSGRFADRRGPFAVAVPGIALGAVGLGVAALAPNALVGYLAMIIIGVGSGSSFPAITSIVTYSAAPAKRGVAVASLLMFNDLGQALAGPLAGKVADGFGWRWVFGVPALVGVVGTIAISTLAVRRRGQFVVPAL
jgi:MFS family permease